MYESPAGGWMAVELVRRQFHYDEPVKTTTVTTRPSRVRATVADALARAANAVAPAGYRPGRLSGLSS
jgi:hypothetical protein